MQETTYIYTLSCPETGLVRYVGKSDFPEKRLVNHLKCEHVHSKKSSWIISLKRKNLKPILEIIDIVPHCDWKIHEQQYIKMFLSCGAKLVNGTMGGDGGLTVDVRKKLSAKNKGKDTLSPEQRIKANKTLVDYVKKHSPWNKGKKYTIYLTTEERLKKSKAQIGRHGGKPVLQYDLDGNFIKEWLSAYSIQKTTGIRFTDVSSSCKTGGARAGFIWKFKINEEYSLKLEPVNKKTIKGKKVFQIDRLGNIVNEYSSPKEAQDKTGFNLKGISFSCCTENKTYKNYFWKYN